jgi:hypothetical protein
MHGAVQVVSQQTPSVQLPEAQSWNDEQICPSRTLQAWAASQA